MCKMESLLLRLKFEGKVFGAAPEPQFSRRTPEAAALFFFGMKRQKRPAGLPHLIVRNMFESVQENKLFKKEVAAARAAMLKAKREAPEAGLG